MDIDTICAALRQAFEDHRSRDGYVASLKGSEDYVILDGEWRLADIAKAVQQALSEAASNKVPRRC